jgi:hypothetical protein
LIKAATTIIVSIQALIFGVEAVSAPVSVRPPAVVVSAPNILQVEGRFADSRQIAVLSDSYGFGEVSDRVSALQRVIGTVRIDGHYGAITRREHLEKLGELGLPSTNVPAVKVSAGSYDIPSDIKQRCPMWEPTFESMGLEPVEVFSYIAYRESHCNPKAINARWDSAGNMIYHLNRDKSWDSGLLQINSSWISAVRKVCGVDSGDKRKDLEVLLDPVCNIKFAKFIMDNSAGKLGNWRVYSSK